MDSFGAVGGVEAAAAAREKSGDARIHAPSKLLPCCLSCIFSFLLSPAVASSLEYPIGLLLSKDDLLSRSDFSEVEVGLQTLKSLHWLLTAV